MLIAQSVCSVVGCAVVGGQPAQPKSRPASGRFSRRRRSMPRLKLSTLIDRGYRPVDGRVEAAGSQGSTLGPDRLFAHDPHDRFGVAAPYE